MLIESGMAVVVSAGKMSAQFEIIPAAGAQLIPRQPKGPVLLCKLVFIV